MILKKNNITLGEIVRYLALEGLCQIRPGSRFANDLWSS